MTKSRNLSQLSGDLTAAGLVPAARLENSGVTAGSYTNAAITVDEKGRITLASNGEEAGASVTVSTTSPVSPASGDLWWNSEEANLYVFYDDGDSAQWVTASIGLKGDKGDPGTTVASAVTYDNTISGLLATNIKTAIDEVQANIASFENQGVVTLASGTVSSPSLTTSGDTNTGMFFPAADTIAFTDGGVERMRITSGGDVGINTSAPTQKLDVIGVTRSTLFSGVNGTSTLFNTASGDNRPLLIGNTNAGGLPNGSLYIDNVNNPNNATFSFINAVAGNVQKFVVLGNGTVANGTGVYSTISDVRIKKDIVDTTPKLDKLLQVRVVNYTRTDDPTESRQLGVIAQELEEIFPGLVDVIEEKDKDGNVTCPDRKSVKYSIFVPMLIKALQEQQTMIESLTARVTSLEKL